MVINSKKETMMTLKKTLTLLAFITLVFGAFATDPHQTSSLRAGARPYSTALGVRGLGTSGLTLKHFTTQTRALEGIVGLGPDAFSLTLLLEQHTSAFDEPGLNWYYGLGGHIATESNYGYRRVYRGYERAPGDFGIGVDGIFGLEYKIREIPMAVSLDVKPFMEVTTNGHVYLAMDPGLGVKFTF